jgi:hypothetical protein
MTNIVTGIYKITNPSGKIYIGQAKDIEKRWAQYRLLICHERKLYRSLRYYGHYYHTFEIIKECSVEELSHYERYYQEYYDVLGDYGLNSSYVSYLVYCEELRKNKYKKVINTETNEIYNSAKELCEILGFNYKRITEKLIGYKKNDTPFRYL